MVALDKTPNIIYNIFNFEEPNVVFLYGVLMLIFMIIFSKIDINYGMLIGLLFFSIVVYYFYTFNRFLTCRLRLSSQHHGSQAT